MPGFLGLPQTRGPEVTTPSATPPHTSGPPESPCVRGGCEGGCRPRLPSRSFSALQFRSALRPRPARSLVHLPRPRPPSPASRLPAPPLAGGLLLSRPVAPGLQPPPPTLPHAAPLPAFSELGPAPSSRSIHLGQTPSIEQIPREGPTPRGRASGGPDAPGRGAQTGEGETGARPREPLTSELMLSAGLMPAYCGKGTRPSARALHAPPHPTARLEPKARPTRPPRGAEGEAFPARRRPPNAPQSPQPQSHPPCCSLMLFPSMRPQSLV